MTTANCVGSRPAECWQQIRPSYFAPKNPVGSLT